MNPTLLLAIPMLPLLAAALAGLCGRFIGRTGAHTLTIAGVAISCVLSIHVLRQLVLDAVPAYDGSVYTWALSDGVRMDVGFLVDRLSALMMVVVTFVSLCVHVYTIGYMRDDPGYTRFFSYISLFTFSMLMLVMHADDHGARGEEQQRLEEGMRHQVKDGRAVGRHAERDCHVAELRERGIRDYPLDVVVDDAEQPHEEGGGRADHQHE